MLNTISCCNIFGGYEIADEIIACRTNTWTLMAKCVSGVCG